MADERPEDLALMQIRGLRREIAALLENQTAVSKQMVRLYEHVAKLSDEMRGLGDGGRDFRSVKSDIIMHENRNIFRHSETNAIRRIEGIERSGKSGSVSDAD